ncbi:MAG: hypothetical protein NTW74_17845 [Acidobacteria bacterium]|nr:hypothetical protein [Acidobacteriota bacterium]
MSNYSIPESILYPMESRQDLLDLANQLRLEYQPQNAAEDEIFERIIVAAWLRKRYEKVRSKLYDKKNAMPVESPNLSVTIDSIRRFQHEVEQQKKQLSNLRKSLRRLRETGVNSNLEDLHEFAPAA